MISLIIELQWEDQDSCAMLQMQKEGEEKMKRRREDQGQDHY